MRSTSSAHVLMVDADGASRISDLALLLSSLRSLPPSPAGRACLGSRAPGRVPRLHLTGWFVASPGPVAPRHVVVLQGLVPRRLLLRLWPSRAELIDERLHAATLGDGGLVVGRDG